MNKFIRFSSSFIMALALVLTFLFLPTDQLGLETKQARATGEITVTKTAELSQFNQDLSNQKFLYTITIQNGDTPYAAPLTLTDVLPPELVCLGTSNPNSSKWWHDSAGCQRFGVANYVMDSSDIFFAGEQATLVFEVTPALTTDQASLVNGNLTLYGPALPRPINGTSLVNPVVNAPAWFIQKTVSPTPAVQMGELLTYSLHVGNSGHYAMLFNAGDTYTVTETLPAEVTAVSWTDLPSAVGYVINNAPQFSWVFTSPGALIPDSFIAVNPLTIAVRVNSGLTVGDVIINRNYNVFGGRNVYTGAVGQPISVTVTAPVTVSLTKQADRATVKPGEWLTYTITVMNETTSQGAITNLYLTDLLDANTTYKSYQTSLPNTVCTPISATSIGCAIADAIAPGQAVALSIGVQANFPLPNGTILTNIYTATHNDPNVVILPPSPLAVNTTVQSAPILDIKKTASASVVKVGEPLTYTIRYTNTGDATATGVVITDVFEDGFGLNVTTQTFMIGSLSPMTGNNTGNTAFTVIVPDTFQLTNTVWLDSAEGVTANDSISTAVIKAGPDLQLSKLTTASSFRPDDFITYTFRFTNNSNMTAIGTYLEDNLPANSSFQDSLSSPLWAYTGGNTYRKDIGQLLPGSIGLVNFVVRVNTPWPTDSPTLVNTGVITYDTQGRFYDDTPFNNIATHTLQVAPPELMLLKSVAQTVQSGDILTYALTYLNDLTSPQQANGVVITETLPPNTTFQNEPSGWQAVGLNQYRYEVGDLPIGTAGVVSFVVKVAPGLPVGLVIANSASIGAMQSVAPFTTTATTTISPSPNLAIRKTTKSLFVQAGDIITYTLAYSNRNLPIAQGVVISEAVAQYTEFMTGTLGWQAVGGNEYSYPVGDVAKESGLITFVVRVADILPDEVRWLTNTVTIRSDSIEADPSDNLAMLVIPVYNPKTSPFLITKSDGNIAVQAGDLLVYTLTYTNKGAVVTTGLVITETVPAYTSFLANPATPDWHCHNGAPEGSICTHVVPDLAIGQSGQITFSVAVDRPLPDSLRQIVNTALIGNGVGDIGLASKKTKIFKPTWVYLPIIRRAKPVTLDLVVSQVEVSNLQPRTGESVVLKVTITNGGTAPIAAPFWVDLYLATAPLEPTVNQAWDEAFSDSLVPLGVGWKVYPPFNSGLVLTNLVPNDPLEPTKNYSNFIPNGLGQWEQSWKGVPLHNYFRQAGTYYLYVLVDSHGVSYGAIAEDNEANNLAGPIIIQVSGEPLPFAPKTIMVDNSAASVKPQPRPTVEP